MKPSELTTLMHAVLDGEATPAETRELERHLAAEPEARAEFDSLRALFDELKGVPQAFPPEGMFASVMAGLSSHQLSAPSRVISKTRPAFTGNLAGSPISDTARASRSVVFSGRERMNEQKSGPRFNRKVIWVGGGIAALAVILVASSSFDFPPGNTSGAIVPAQRFRAEQPATTSVSAPGQSQSAQGTAGNIGDARSSDARMSDALKADGRADSLSSGRVNARQDGRADGRVTVPLPTARHDGRADGLLHDRIDAVAGWPVPTVDGACALHDGRRPLRDGRARCAMDAPLPMVVPTCRWTRRCAMDAPLPGWPADGLSDGRAAARWPCRCRWS